MIRHVNLGSRLAIKNIIDEKWTVRKLANDKISIEEPGC